MTEIILNRKTGRYQYNIPNDGDAHTYVGLVNQIRKRKKELDNMDEDVKKFGPIARMISSPIDMIAIGLTINKLIKRRKEWNLRKYDWLRDRDILNLLTSGDEPFLIAYSILEQKNIL